MRFPFPHRILGTKGQGKERDSEQEGKQSRAEQRLRGDRWLPSAGIAQLRRDNFPPFSEARTPSWFSME